MQRRGEKKINQLVSPPPILIKSPLPSFSGSSLTTRPTRPERVPEVWSCSGKTFRDFSKTTFPTCLQTTLFPPILKFSLRETKQNREKRVPLLGYTTHHPPPPSLSLSFCSYSDPQALFRTPLCIPSRPPSHHKSQPGRSTVRDYPSTVAIPLRDQGVCHPALLVAIVLSRHGHRSYTAREDQSPQPKSRLVNHFVTRLGLYLTRS